MRQDNASGSFECKTSRYSQNESERVKVFFKGFVFFQDVGAGVKEFDSEGDTRKYFAKYSSNCRTAATSQIVFIDKEPMNFKGRLWLKEEKE